MVRESSRKSTLNFTFRRLIMNAIKTIVRTTTLAAVAALGLAAGAANAISFNFDHDQADLVTTRASFVFAAMNWGQEIGGNAISGSNTGQLTYHGGVAGCAKIRVLWKNAAGTQLATDVSGEACSNSSLPSLVRPVSESFSSDQLRGARVEMLLKEFNGSYKVIAGRSMVAGGN
jgi:hypothetical protein